jgi:hypothetical protein
VAAGEEKIAGEVPQPIYGPLGAAVGFVAVLVLSLYFSGGASPLQAPGVLVEHSRESWYILSAVSAFSPAEVK